MKVTEQVIENGITRLIKAAQAAAGNDNKRRQRELVAAAKHLHELFDVQALHIGNKITEFHGMTGINVMNCVIGAIEYMSYYERLLDTITEDDKARLEATINEACQGLHEGSHNTLELCFAISSVTHVMSEHMVVKTQEHFDDPRLKPMLERLGFDKLPSAGELATVIGIAAGIIDKVREETRNG